MRYILALFATILLILALIVLLLRHSSGSSKAPITTKKLASYAKTDSSVTMTIDGPINSDQEHLQIKIAVNADEVVYQQIQGYQDTPIKTRSYDNNTSAYNNFLHALAHAGFTKGKNSAAGSELGYCPMGNRYVFELNQDGKEIERYWTTTCGQSTYNGVAPLTIKLFEAQVPDYMHLTGNLNI